MFNQKNVKDSHTRTKGFSLIELLITLSLMSLLLIFTIQSYQPIRLALQSRLVLHHLMNHLQLARSEAIRSNQIVTFCKSNNGENCSGDWRDGQIIIKNAKKPQLLHKFDAISTGNLDFRAFQSKDFLRFTAKGTTFEQNGHFIYCPTGDKQPAQAVIIEKSGRARACLKSR